MYNYLMNWIMKKFYSNLMMMAVALFSVVTFTSCDEDIDEAMILSGEWSGDFGMYYEAQHPRTGRWYAFDAEYTNLKFYQYDEYSTRGYGKQVDFYREGPYAYQYYDFYWEVRNGIIYLDYPYDPELNVAIRDYRLNYSKFSGWIGDVHFELYKLRDFYWDSYDGYYGCGWSDGWYWDDFYYSKTRGVENPESVDMDELNIRRGNRFMEGKKSAE
jgi:hypothetical protein